MPPAKPTAALTRKRKAPPRLRLRRDFLLAPVTALAFYVSSSTGRECLIVGEDTELKVYETDGKGSIDRLRCRLDCFRAQPIHGICVSPAQETEERAATAASSSGRDTRALLIWGNRRVAAIPASVIEEQLTVAEEDTGAQGPGPSPSLSPSSSPSSSIPEMYEAEAPDWIFDGVFSPDGKRCFLVTAHNEICELHLNLAPGTSLVSSRSGCETVGLSLQRVFAPARPALYSATLTFMSDVDVLVAGGTVFGEIVVWKCNVGSGTAVEPPSPEVLFVFRGHEGSIFGVDISPEVDVIPDLASSGSKGEGEGEGGRSRGRFLASCSDDRTVRIWDVSDAADMRGTIVYDNFSESKDTGFGESKMPGDADAALASVAGQSSAPIAVAMGHLSRIWNVKFGRGEPGASGLKLPVYSFGEDATVWKWNLDVNARARRQRQDLGDGDCSGVVNEDLDAKLTHQNTFSYHEGKHIWAAAVRSSGSPDLSTNLIVTGGADGRANLIIDTSSGGPDGTPPVSNLQMLLVQDIIDGLPPTPAPNREYFPLPKGRGDYMQQFVLLASDTMLATTKSGRALLGSFSPAPAPTWKEIIPDAGLEAKTISSCTAMRSLAPGIAVLGTTGGRLLLYRDESIRELGTLSGKISNLFCLDVPGPDNRAFYSRGTETGPQMVDLLVSTMGSADVLQLIAVNIASCTMMPAIAVPDQHPSYIATSARLLTPKILAVGYRSGYLSLFQRFENELGFAWCNRRATDAINSIVPLPDQTISDTSYRGPDAAPFHFLTTSRDGNYRIYEMQSAVDSHQVDIRLRHEKPCPVFATLEAVWFAPTTDTQAAPSSDPTTDGNAARPGWDLILTGFRSRDFIVYNETRRQELARIDCGGVNRVFTYRPHVAPHRSDAFRFAFGKASQLGLYRHVPEDEEEGKAEEREGETNEAMTGTREKTRTRTRTRISGHETVKKGAHGREIRGVAAKGAWVVTGSEDTSVRIWERRKKRPDNDRSTLGDAPHAEGLECVTDVKAHEPGIQTLKFADAQSPAGDDVLFSCAGNEELMVWRIRRLAGSSSFAGAAVQREAELRDKSEDADLRITDFDVTVLGARAMAGGEGGTMGNAVGTTTPLDDEFGCLISIALSDSTFKTYAYTTSAGFRLLAVGRYTGACVTQVRHLHVDIGGPGEDGRAKPHNIEILTAASDGHIAVWTAGGPGNGAPSPPLEYAPVLITGLHQSSIKALDITQHHESSRDGAGSGPNAQAHRFLVLTGGDDNALGILALSRANCISTETSEPQSAVHGPARYQVQSKWGVKSAHAAAINGLKTIRGGPGIGDPGANATTTFVTVSNDQRLKAWRLQSSLLSAAPPCNSRGGDGDGDGNRKAQREDDVRITLLADVYSGVADPGDVDILDDYGADGEGERNDMLGRVAVVVVGVGMEVWRLDLGRETAT